MGQQASGTRVRLSFVEETTLGTTPTTPVTKLLPFTTEDLGTIRDPLVSASNRGERVIREIRPGKRTTKGSINFELDAGTWGTFFKHLLGNNTTTGVGPPYTHTMKGSDSLLATGLSIEKAFLDLAQHIVFRGCKIQSLALNLPANGLITGTWNILGMYEGTGTGTGAGTPGGTSIDASPDDISDLPMAEWEGAVLWGGSAFNKLSSLAANIENGINEDGFAFGNRDRYQMTPGQRVSKLVPTISLEDMNEYTDFVNAVDKAIKITITRGSLSVELLFPKVTLIGGDSTPKSGGKEPITIQLPSQAKYDATEGTDVKVTIINNVATI